MGTSSDYGGGRGGVWTPYKHAASNFVRRGGGGRARKVLSRYVATAGGAGGAGRSSRSGVSSAQSVAALGAGLAGPGLTPTLEAFGLDHLIGATRFEVLNGLLEVIAGTAGDLEEQAASAAACDVLEDLYPPDAESYEELEAIGLDADGVVELVERFIAAYVYNRMLPTIAERFARLQDPEVVRRRDAELRESLELLVALRLDDRDPLAIDWQGDEGRAVIEGLMNHVYEDMEDQEP